MNIALALLAIVLVLGCAQEKPGVEGAQQASPGPAPSQSPTRTNEGSPSQVAPSPPSFAPPVAPPTAGTSPAPTGPQWTVMVYMAADNNLETFALQDLAEMARVGSSQQVNVVAQVDRRARDSVNQGVLNLPDWQTTKRLKVEQGQLAEIADIGETNMSDPTVLSDFITWAKSAYPAERYALVLWDHGGAWLGFATDDSARSELMSLPQLASALKATGITLDFLGFDACLMASAELAMELYPYARTLTASEELEPGIGWDYAAFLGALASSPSMSGLELGKALADSYIAGLKRDSPAESMYSTMSVIDLAQAPQFKAAFSAFVGALQGYMVARSDLKEKLTRVGQVVQKARYEAPAFGKQEVTDPGIAFDLGILVDNMLAQARDDRLASAGADLKAAISRMVHSVRAGDGYKDTSLSGLSLFVPVSPRAAAATKEKYTLLESTRETGWPDLLLTMAEAAGSDTTAPVVAQPKVDAPAVVPGKGSITVSGQVTDDFMVTGVVVGVVQLRDEQPAMVGLQEQPRTYSVTNGFTYAFDGQGWYLEGNGKKALVFAVQWRPGQLAVFGRYRQDRESGDTTAYFVYDEASGELVEGFEVAGGALGALLPDASSTFQPFLLTPGLQTFEAEAVPVQGTRLTKGPLPPGQYLISVTGFDLGDNAHTNGVLVEVRAGEGQEAAGCQTGDVDAASMPGEHNARLTIGVGQSIPLGLSIDRNLVGEVRYTVDVFGGDSEIELENVGPDGATVGASGRVSGHASDVFQPQLSGLYTLHLSNPTGGEETVFLTWTVSPRAGLDLPDPIDLNASPEQIDAFEQPGLHIGMVTVPAGQSVVITLALDGEATPWLGYSVQVPEGPTPVLFALASPDQELLDSAPVCSLHMGGVRLDRSGQYTLVFDNSQGSSPRQVALSLETYGAGPSPYVPVRTERLPEWATGDHSREFTLAPSEVLLLVIPLDSAVSSRVDFSLTRGTGMVSIDYGVVDPDGAVLVAGTHDYLVQESFPIPLSGDYALVLDNSMNNKAKTVLVSVSVAGAIQGTPPPAGTPPPPAGPPQPAPTAPPAPSPTPAGPTVYSYPEWATGGNYGDFTLPAGRVAHVVVPFDRALVSRVDFTLSGVSGSGSIRYRVLAPDGMELTSGTQGYLTQDAFAVNVSGEYTIVLDNSANTSSRTVRLSLYVRAR